MAAASPWPSGNVCLEEDAGGWAPAGGGALRPHSAMAALTHLEKLVPCSPYRQPFLPAVVIPGVGTGVTASRGFYLWFPHTEGMVPRTLWLKVYIYFPHRTEEVPGVLTCPIHLEISICNVFLTRTFRKDHRVRPHQVRYRCIPSRHPLRGRLGTPDVFPFAFVFAYMAHYRGVIHNTAERPSVPSLGGYSQPSCL